MLCTLCMTDPCICLRPNTRIFQGGGKRDDESVPMYSLLPRAPLARVCERYGHGIVKYGRHNWRTGLPAAECLDRAFEHMYKHIEGYIDEDHLAAAVFNIFCVMQYEKTHPELIDYKVPEESIDEPITKLQPVQTSPSTQTNRKRGGKVS